MTSRARQCKSNGIRVNALLGFGFSEPSREPVAAAQHRLGAITGGKRSRPRKGGFAQLLVRGSSRFRLEVHAAADIAEVETVKLQRHVSFGHGGRLLHKTIGKVRPLAAARLRQQQCSCESRRAARGGPSTVLPRGKRDTSALEVDACAGIEEVKSFERHGPMIEIFVDQIEIR